jgi:hypothetical protein
MDELTYDFLTEVQGRWQAELLKSYFEACGIDVELFQESLGQHIYPTTLDILGNVHIYVPKTQLTAARKLLEEYFNPPPEEEEVAKPRAVKKSTGTTSRKKEAASKTTRRKPK